VCLVGPAGAGEHGAGVVGEMTRSVWLVDFDGKIENLALMRLSTWYKGQGYTVSLKRLNGAGIEAACPPLFDRPSKVCISCIFRWNKEQAERLVEQWAGQASWGGTGVAIDKTLPQGAIDCEPDYRLYNQARAIGFISRGCNNHCPWCVVWRKEGRLHRVSTAKCIVGERTEAIFLDNNILALPDHERDLEWLARQSVAIDFNQGLDAKYVTDENAPLLASCRWKSGPRLALDSNGRIPIVARALERLEKAGISPRRVTLFILIGFSGIDSDIRRLMQARQWGVNAFPMGFRDLATGEEPALEWDRGLYRKYKRLIIRLPQATQVWRDFEAEVAT